MSISLVMEDVLEEKIFLQYFRKLASRTVSQKELYHRLYQSATYGQNMKGIQVMGERAAWKSEKILLHL